MTLFWCTFDFRKCFENSSWSSHSAGICHLSYKIHFSSHVTIWSRNSSFLLCRIRENDTSKWQFFWFVVSSWGTQWHHWLDGLEFELQETVKVREAWHAASPWGCRESDTTEQLNDNTRHPLIKLFHLSILIQMRHNGRIVDVQFFSNFSCSWKSALMMLSSGPGQLIMAGHYTFHLQGSYLLCNASWTTIELY